VRANASISRRVTDGAISASPAATTRTAGDQRIAGRHDAHGGDELGRRRALEQEAARPGAQRLVDILVKVEGRQHEDPRRRIDLRDDAPRRLQPVDVRHADVHDDDVGTPPLGTLDRLQAVLGLADDLHVLLRAEDGAQPGANEFLVVGDENPRAGIPPAPLRPFVALRATLTARLRLAHHGSLTFSA
jgi:hypothetical protein